MPTMLTGTSLAQTRPRARLPSAKTNGTSCWRLNSIMLLSASSRPPADKNYHCVLTNWPITLKFGTHINFHLYYRVTSPNSKLEFNSRRRGHRLEKYAAWARSGLIWMKFGWPTQNRASTTIKWSESELEAEIQYGGLLLCHQIWTFLSEWCKPVSSSTDVSFLLTKVSDRDQNVNIN